MQHPKILRKHVSENSQCSGSGRICWRRMWALRLLCVSSPRRGEVTHIQTPWTSFSTCAHNEPLEYSREMRTEAAVDLESDRARSDMRAAAICCCSTVRGRTLWPSGHGLHLSARVTPIKPHVNLRLCQCEDHFHPSTILRRCSLRIIQYQLIISSQNSDFIFDSYLTSWQEVTFLTFLVIDFLVWCN